MVRYEIKRNVILLTVQKYFEKFRLTHRNKLRIYNKS